MATKSALTIPEILIRIGTFLSRNNLIQCARVCSSWNAIFHPLIWKSVSLGGSDWAPNHDLIQQTSHIRSLRLHNKISSDKCEYARIYLQDQLLSFCVEWIDKGKRWSEAISDLWSDISLIVVNNSSTLQSLTLRERHGIPLKNIAQILCPGNAIERQDQAIENEMDNISSDAEKCLRIRAMPRTGFANLRFLALEDILIPTIQVLESIVLVCQQLESLKLVRITIPYRRMGFGLRDLRLPVDSVLNQLLEPEGPLNSRHSQFHHQQRQRVEYPRLQVLDLYRVLACDSRALWAWFVAPCSNLRQLRWTIAQDQGFPAYAVCGNSRGYRRIEGRIQKNQNWILRRPFEELAISGKTTLVEDASLKWILEQGSVKTMDQSVTPRVGCVNQNEGFRLPDHIQQQPDCRTKLRALSVPRSGFGPLAFDAFWRAEHDRAICELDLLRCKHVSSTMILDLLTGCPSLEKFAADEVLGEDVLRDERPWVCTRLKQLNVYFNINASTNPPKQHCLHVVIRDVVSEGDNFIGDTADDYEHDNDSTNSRHQQFTYILAIREAVFNRLGLLTELRDLNTDHFITPLVIGLWASPMTFRWKLDIDTIKLLNNETPSSQSPEDACHLRTLKWLSQILRQEICTPQTANHKAFKNLPILDIVVEWREESFLRNVEKALMSLRTLVANLEG